MLELDSRALLLELLRPPDGYALDHAVGTTFSLDLTALLAAPLAFTYFGWETEDGRVTMDPLALLEALRRNGERITLFCQAGQIAVPAKSQPLFGYLEGSVFEVALERGGVFHPKVWLLRFIAAEKPARYRFLCLSRNLTFDRSWDTALVLEGDVADRTTAIFRNHPLGDFIAALADLAATVRPLTEARAKILEKMQAEVRRVKFELPDGFDDLKFWPLGFPFSTKWPFPDSSGPTLVMAPFVTDATLRRLVWGREGSVLISRLETLQGVSTSTLQLFDRAYAMNPDVDVDASNESGGDAGTDQARSLSGLHTKLFAIKEGWDARVWTGSANATNSAFGSNVEFLVELAGRWSQCGIDALLAERKGKASFRDLLVPFATDGDQEPSDPTQRLLDQDLQEARNLLARSKLVARIEASEEPETYSVALVRQGPEAKLPSRISARVWPITLDESAGVPVSPEDHAAVFRSVSWQALTSFFAFEVEAVRGERRAGTRFVLNLPLEGGPADRTGRLLRSVLADGAGVLRFLLLLLSESAEDTVEGMPVERIGSGWPSEQTPWVMQATLFEVLLKSLARDTDRLESVGRLVKDLRSTSEGQGLLPPKFDEVFNPIWEAYRKARNGR